jgi:xanthine dehydrogenase accessory factor
MRRARTSDSYHDTDDVVEPALGWLREGRSVAVATVLRTWGSSPRPVGSQLAVDDRGTFVGSVSGGCVEAATVEAARAVLSGTGPERLEFGVADSDAWQVGLACGGRIEVLVHAVTPYRDLFEQLAADRGQRRGAALEIDLGTGTLRLLHAFGETTSTLYDDRFVRVHAPALRLFVVGAVHVAVPLVQMAAIHGFDVVVIDPRSAFASAERFGGIDVRVEWPDEAFSGTAPDPHSAVVVLSHDPKIDDPALAAALASGAPYVGALGSRRTHAARLERLAARGLSPDSLDRIHSPVGLDIGARSAAEIATAILAEIVQTVRRKSP